MTSRPPSAPPARFPQLPGSSDPEDSTSAEPLLCPSFQHYRSHSVEIDNSGLTDNCVARTNSLAAGVMPTPPPSLVHSSKYGGDADVTATPSKPNTREVDLCVVPAETADKKSAR